MIISKIAIYFVNLKSLRINFTKYIAMISRDKITEIFCMADDFCKLYDRFIKANGLAPKRDKSKRKYHRDSRMSSAEIITIMILFHLSGYKCFKHFYINEGEFYQFNLSSCIRQQNSLTAQFVSFSLSNLANIFYPPNFYNN